MSLSDINRAARGKRPDFHSEAAIDRLVSMVMALTGEVAVLRQRLDTVERVADEKGAFSRSDLERFTPDATAAAAQESMRQEILANVFYWVSKDVRDVVEKETPERYIQSIEAIAQDR